MPYSIHDINELLKKEDIEGLIEAGAPADEYEDEAVQIAVALGELEPKNFQVDMVLSVITLVWMKSFELTEQDIILRASGIERVALAIISAHGS